MQLAAGRIGLAGDQHTSLIVQVRPVRVLVVPDRRASAKAEAAPLGVHFVGVDPDDIADAEGPGGEDELLLFVITVSEQPAQQLLRVFARVSDLHVLV